MRIWTGFVTMIRTILVRTGFAPTASYVGIATIRGDAGLRVPVYRKPQAKGQPIGFLAGGQYAPHFTATADRTWLRVTLHDGSQGWLQNDPAQVTVTLPDPSKVRLCIDLGHGGSDTGAVDNCIVEKALNFSIAFTNLGPRLQGDSRIDRVWFTRTGDDTVSLTYRTARNGLPA